MRPTEIQEHRERQDELLAESQEIMAAADAAKRDLTPGEVDNIKANVLDFDRRKALIEAHQSVMDQEAELGRPQGRQTEPDDMPAGLGRPYASRRSMRHARIVNGGDRKVFAEFRDVLTGNRPMAAMSVGSDQDGGAMVPRQIDNRILDQLVDISPVRRVAEVVQTASADYVAVVSR